MDKKRKDSTMMLMHHLVTIMLVYVSYIARYYYHGCIVFFLHDISDAILETGKVCVYINNRGGKKRKWGEYCTNVAFFLFTVTWFYFRIYLYPTRLLHASNWCAYIVRNTWYPRLYLFFNFLLWSLYVMQIIWSCYIVKMCIRLLTGKDKQVEDIREREMADSTGQYMNGTRLSKKAD
uniref:TLC domain-containing protein n=1 Tax=Mesocestoides corti TaxID=53468 RepID=A0A5K3FL78_MESCO